MKIIITLFYLLFSVLYAETYPLAQKPFLDNLSASDDFQRGVFLIVAASSDLVDVLNTDSELIGN